MKARTGTFFICGIRYEKMEDGSPKKVTEQYVVEALSFTEAEERITEEMSAYISGEFDVKKCAVAPFLEVVFFEEKANADKWYKAKVAYITFDDKSGKEKRRNVLYLIQAGSMTDAVDGIKDFFANTMIDYSVIALQETPFIDVFEYEPKEEAKE